MAELLRSSHESGVEPWSTMYLEGHGEHWDGTVAFIGAHLAVWADALR